MNLITKIENAIRSDDEDTDDQSAILIEYYQEASDESKQVIDNIFICLCGYSLKTLIS